MARNDDKPTNPKDALGSMKIPYHLFPDTAVMLGAIAFLDGGLKYGRGNYRHDGARASIYHDAARRHLAAWFEGEEVDQKTGVPHLGYALACIAILIDCQELGNLQDDRAFPGAYIEMIEKYTPLIAKLKKLNAGKKPRHYSHEDA